MKRVVASNDWYDISNDAILLCRAYVFMSRILWCRVWFSVAGCILRKVVSFMSNQSGIHRGGLLLIVSLFGMGIAFAAWVGWSSDHQSVPDRITSLPSLLPIPPYSESRLLNV